MNMNMMISKLTPAETLLLRDGNQVSARELLKYTMMDLLLKQVLEIQHVARQAHPRDPVRETRYVVRGKHFGAYDALLHEDTFMGALENTSTMLFRNCVQVAYARAGTERALHRTVRSTPMIREVFSNSLLDRLLNNYRYTDSGLKLRCTIESELADLQRELPKLLETDKAKALALLRAIGGNIFLVKNIDFKMLREIDQAFPEREIADYAGGDVIWIDYDSYAGDFDSSCASSSGWCGGDGGDSGDSGDGGCGGCGGCGGD